MKVIIATIILVVIGFLLGSCGKEAMSDGPCQSCYTEVFDTVYGDYPTSRVYMYGKSEVICGEEFLNWKGSSIEYDVSGVDTIGYKALIKKCYDDRK